MTAVILAGGHGLRMGDACRSLPKPMLSIGEKPILQWQIEALSEEGITDFILIVGYLHETIIDYFGDGQRFNVQIRYYVEPFPMGTGGALKKLNLDDDFLLLNGDLLFDISLQPFLDYHFSKSAWITLYAHPNTHPFDSLLLEQDPLSGKITACGRNDDHQDTYPNLCNAGIQIVSPKALALAEERKVLSFDRDVLIPNIKAGHVYAYKNSECIFDVGTPERFAAGTAMAVSGFVKKRKRTFPQKAVFLDRDGTINKYKGFISNQDALELIPGVAKAIATFHALGYLVIVITNQPVVARGLCSISELQRIHNRMEMLLGADGTYVDDIYFCPHHPDKGYPNENSQYKVPCSCRKPSPGLIWKAKDHYHIDLRYSYMVGDRSVDVETARNAGCIPVFLRCGVWEEPLPDVLSFDDLSAFSKYLLKERS